MPFQRLHLAPTLVRNTHTLGYDAPTAIQAQAIPLVRAGRDLLATAPTGTGKTAAFLLPVLDRLLSGPRPGVGALVLTPTRELAQQIHAVCRGFMAGTSLRVVATVGGLPEGPQLRALRAGADVLVATPGRLLAYLRAGQLALPHLRTLVLDEADQMFDLGFFPDMKRILAFLPAARQTLLFSATMPPEVERLGRAILRDPAAIAVGVPGAATATVRHTAYPVPAGRKTALLEHLLERLENPSVLVFTRTRRGAKRLAAALQESGHAVAALHGDCSPSQRQRALAGFRSRSVAVLVATNVAARGLDVRHVTHVVNYDVPDAVDEYVHRIGRTGRAGDEGDALVLVAPEERALLARIERRLGRPIPARHEEDFDYGPARAPAKMPAGRHRPTGQPDRRRSPAARKPSRGQGRR